LKCDEKKFSYAEFIFDYSYSEDEKLLDKLVDEGKQLATVVNPTLARDASRKRKYETILRNSVAGVIAEYCWRYWLRSQAKALNIEATIESNIFESFDKHVDITITYKDGTRRTIEVRSSFPYTGLQNAVCRAFDIIGWYVNPVKTKEIQKEYYLRTLYPFHSTELWGRLKSDSFSAFLTGGATRHILKTGQYSLDKKFIPRDDIDAMLSFQSGVYRVVQPIINAFDTPKITEYILKGLQ